MAIRAKAYIFAMFAIFLFTLRAYTDKNIALSNSEKQESECS